MPQAPVSFSLFHVILNLAALGLKVNILHVFKAALFTILFCILIFGLRIHLMFGTNVKKMKKLYINNYWF